MKKRNITSISPKLKKERISNLNPLTGGADPTVSELSGCCSKPPLCYHTLTTRPDSLAPRSKAAGVGG